MFYNKSEYSVCNIWLLIIMVNRKKLLKFLVLWWSTYGINIWLTYYLSDILLIDPKFSYLISLLLITWINFLSSLKLIFEVNYSNKVFIRYICTLLCFMAINYSSVLLLTYGLPEINKYAIIFFVTTLLFFAKFFSYNKYVFKN